MRPIIRHPIHQRTGQALHDRDPREERAIHYSGELKIWVAFEGPTSEARIWRFTKNGQELGTWAAATGEYEVGGVTGKDWNWRDVMRRAARAET